jgi:hypothetical protein
MQARRLLNSITNPLTDIDKTIITSPILSIVTYSLRDAFQFLVTHERRHINQAVRVKGNENFPPKKGAHPIA